MRNKQSQENELVAKKPGFFKRIFSKGSQDWIQQLEDYASYLLYFSQVSEPDFVKKLSLSFQKLIWVYIAVNRVSTNSGKVPLKVYEVSTDRKLETNKYPTLTQLFRKPNPYMTMKEFMEAVIVSLLLSGNAFIEVSGTFTDPEALWWINPTTVRINPDPKKYVKNYEIVDQRGQVVATLQPDEMLHIKFHNPHNSYWGLSPLQAAANSLETDYYAIEYNKNFFRNSGRPDGVLETDQVLNDKILRRLRRHWKETYGSYKKSHQVAVLEGGLRYKQITINSKDMDYLQQRKFNREEILALFGVPPAVAGIFEYANYANAREQRRLFVENTIQPLVDRICEIFSESLLSNFPNIQIQADYSNLPELREGWIQQQKQDLLDVQNGILLINDIRRKRGLTDVPWGDTWWRPANLVPYDTPIDVYPAQAPAQSSIHTDTLLEKLSQKTGLTEEEICDLIEAKLFETKSDHD